MSSEFYGHTKHLWPSVPFPQLPTFVCLDVDLFQGCTLKYSLLYLHPPCYYYLMSDNLDCISNLLDFTFQSQQYDNNTCNFLTHSPMHLNVMITGSSSFVSNMIITNNNNNNGNTTAVRDNNGNGHPLSAPSSDTTRRNNNSNSTTATQNNPLVQGYHLLTDSGRIHETSI
jgi:hypothetical protein